MKARICVFLFVLPFIFQSLVNAETKIDGIEAKSAILIEADTGSVLYEMNADERLPIASVTKIMTMLLIMEAVDEGVTSLNDMVTVSENAMSYGGSTMFLEAGEELSVNDMLKGIAVASANDGCVAMAEYLSGSETAFVDKMNEKAKELGMTNTNFLNTNGLDEDGHYSSARDVSVMSKELLKHKKITDYTSIWTDELRDGKFQLANTNKLIRFYNGANGLKTGSTSEALCCLSASAKRDDMQLIAVVLGAPTSEKRFNSAKAMLNFGFANYKLDKLVTQNEFITDADVVNGSLKTVKAIAKSDKFKLTEKSNIKEIQKNILLNSRIEAPLKKGDIIGVIEFHSGGTVIDKVELVAAEDIEKKGVFQIITDIVIGFM